MENKSVIKEVCDEKHNTINEFLKNDKEAIAKLVTTTEKLTENQIKTNTLLEEFKKDSNFYRETIITMIKESKPAKLTFWDTENGKKLFNVGLLLLVTVIVMAFGIRITDAINLLK